MKWSSLFFRNAAVLFASAVLSVAAIGCGGGSAEGEGAKTAADEKGGDKGGADEGAEAPEIDAEDVTGEGPTTIKEAKGKVVIVDFWATFCHPCKKSFPKYQALMDEFGNDLAIIAVSVDGEDDVTKETLEKFAEETGAKFKIMWDTKQATAKKYSPAKMPTSFVIDKEGVIRHVHAGYEAGEEDKIAEEIKELIGKE